MKIVHVVQSLEVGGAEVLVVGLSRFQHRRGDDVSVLCLTALGALGEQLRAEGIAVTNFQSAGGLGLFRRVRGWMRQARPDVVHCHNPFATIYAAPAGRLAGATVVSTRHSLVAPPYDRKLELEYSFASRFCHWVVGVCDATAANLRRAPLAARKKITRVYNGIEGLRLNGRRQDHPGSFNLLHVGRLTPAKDQATLLRAMAMAKSEVPGLRLDIAGDGPLRAELESLMRELHLEQTVTFHGEVQDVVPLFCSSDLFVLSSISEGLPVALLEAMSARVPFLVTDVGGMTEVAQGGATGTLAPARYPAALAKAIVACSRDHDLLVAKAERAYALFESRFTLATMAEGYDRLFATAMRGKATA